MQFSKSPAFVKRIKTIDPEAGRCIVFTCSRLCQRAMGDGLSQGYCSRHIEHIRRHGHSTAKTPPKAHLEPYRRAANLWYRGHATDYRVAQVVKSLDTMLIHSGRVASAYDLQGMPMEGRAANVLARNREAGKTGSDMLTTVLALRAYIEANGPYGAPDYRHTQIAKLLHRVSSGTNRTPSGFALPRKNPRPEGRFMVYLGQKVDDQAAIAADQMAVSEVLQIVAQNTVRS